MTTRDGACTSLWQDISPYTVKNELPSGGEFDIAIVGGGITGLTVGLLLQKTGKKCAIFEANTICFGTTAATTAHINSFVDTPFADIAKNFGKANAQFVANAILGAIDLIKENISNQRIDCDFEEKQAFLFAASDDEVSDLKSIMDGMIEVGLMPEYTTSIPVPFAFEKAIKIGEQAKFHPLKYCFGLARAYEEAGGIIYENCRVTSEDENEKITVTTDLGNFLCGHLIYATHIPPGINLLNLRCAPYRSYSMAMVLADGAYPESLVYDMKDPYHYYRTHYINGKKYLIAGGEDHKTGHSKNAEASFLRLESYVRSHFNVEKMEYKWSSQYFEPVDGLPYIGHFPGRPGNVLLASGYGGNGMMYSHVAAKVLANLILQKEDVLIGVFDPNRLKPIAGFANFVKENADVLKQYASKWFSADKLNELAGLAPGEGRIVKYDGKDIALYKDDNGTLKALSPICTHMGCQVTWNNAEKSWDCPCHGARYSPEGDVLTGPATVNLEKIPLSGE